jgi:hypothetical protein
MKQLSFLISTLLFPTLVSIFSISCNKGVSKPSEVVKPANQITLINPGFEDSTTGWAIQNDSAYTNGDIKWGITVQKDRYGSRYLNFYAPQNYHKDSTKPDWVAPNWTPWNGGAYQTVSNLKDGNYTLKCKAAAVGYGMFLWADGGEKADSVAFKSSVYETKILEFIVKGGTAKIGFRCSNADGTQPALLAPWFNADDVELWTESE